MSNQGSALDPLDHAVRCCTFPSKRHYPPIGQFHCGVIMSWVADNPMPIRELKAFTRIHLQAGEHQTVTFDLPPDRFTRFGLDGQENPATGRFKLFVGGGQPRDCTGLEVEILRGEG